MKIVLLLVYIGKWPPWFPAFLLSCKYNGNINWLVFTDCEIPDLYPENVEFITFSMADFRKLATEKLGFPVTHDDPYKLCDFKPAYGLIFESYLAGNDFWGHCDLDVIWGDIGNFITDDVLEGHDVISSRKNKMSGHFSLYRNTPQINRLYTLHRQHVEILADAETVSFDEVAMTVVVEAVMKQGYIRVYWPRFVLDDEFVTELRINQSGWEWRKGKLYNLNDNDKEIMYLHFSEWKKSLREVDFNYADYPESFEITADRIRLTHH